MVKTGQERSDKYGQKFDATVVAARYTATMESSKAKQVAMQQALSIVNAQVRAILNEAGVFPIQTIQYQAFANKLFGICNRFAGMMTTHVLSNSAIAQANAEYVKWKAYGTTAATLQLIWALFSDMLGEAPSPL